VRYSYAAGLLIISSDFSEKKEQSREHLEKSFRELGLNEEQIAKILIDSESFDKETLKTVIQTLDEPLFQIMFLIEARLLLKKLEIADETVEKLIEGFGELFKMNSEHKEQLRKLFEAFQVNDLREILQGFRSLFDNDLKKGNMTAAYFRIESVEETLKELQIEKKSVAEEIVRFKNRITEIENKIEEMKELLDFIDNEPPSALSRAFPTAATSPSFAKTIITGTLDDPRESLSIYQKKLDQLLEKERTIDSQLRSAEQALADIFL